VGNERYSEKLIRRTFNIPLGPPFDLEKGLRALDKVNATGFFDLVWLDLEPVDTGLRIVLRVRDGPRNRIEVGARYDEEVRARGIVRVRNRNTFGFGEQTEILGVASEAETAVGARILGDRLISTFVGYDVSVRSVDERPRFFVLDRLPLTTAASNVTSRWSGPPERDARRRRPQRARKAYRDGGRAPGSAL
jgi:outer membrane protein assembly factor BamA